MNESIRVGLFSHNFSLQPYITGFTEHIKYKGHAFWNWNYSIIFNIRFYIKHSELLNNQLIFKMYKYMQIYMKRKYGTFQKSTSCHSTVSFLFCCYGPLWCIQHKYKNKIGFCIFMQSFWWCLIIQICHEIMKLWGSGSGRGWFREVRSLTEMGSHITLISVAEEPALLWKHLVKYILILSLLMLLLSITTFNGPFL